MRRDRRYLPMNKIPLILKNLFIYKMPGFQKGLKNYKNFSPFINVIAGPNASGKSSTARMIQKIIWRDQTKDLQAEASLSLDNEKWQIKIDSSTSLIQQDGRAAQLSGLPPAESADRYMLALQELFIKDENELAKHIAKESIGGFDLDAAKNVLDYRNTIKNKRSTEYKVFLNAKEKYENLKQKQKNLKKEEEKLKSLRDKKINTEKSLKLKDFYKTLKTYLEARKNYVNSKVEMESYPEVLGKATGQELNDIEEIEKDINNAQNDLAKALEKKKSCEKRLSELNIPERGINEKLLGELEERIESLENFEQKINEKENKIENLRIKEQEALRVLGKDSETLNLMELDFNSVIDIEKFFSDAHQTFSRKKFLETEIEELKQELSGNQEKTDKIKEGIKNLSLWLREQKRMPGVSKNWLFVISLMGILAILGGIISLWGGILGSVVLIFLSIYALQKEISYETGLREKDFRNTTLPLPEAWDTENVSDRLESLIEELHNAEWENKVNDKIKTRKKELNELQKSIDVFNEIYNQWQEKLKIMPELPEENLKNYNSLFWFLKHLKDWKDNYTEIKSLEQEKILLVDKYDNELEEINKLFKESQVEKVDSLSKAKATFKTLKNKQSIYKEKKQEKETQEQIIAEKEEGITENTEKLKAIYHKLQVDYNEKSRVKEIIEKLDNYKEIKQKYLICKNKLEETEKQLTEHPLYEDYKNEINNLTIDELEGKIKECAKEGEELENITQKITRIETNINNAKKENELELALTEKENCLEKLKELYDKNLSSLTGDLVVERLKEETREKNRPAVFKRANELFNRITKGRYELRLEEKESPEFKAFDTILNFGQYLSELSTGTRLQLLLSVRIAYIEAQEFSIKLPVLADELLANSDDTRAKAIIDALIEISRDGRQVFYFTAQKDEVGKWKSHIDKNISYKIIELTGEDENENIQRLYDDPFYESFILSHENIPSPENKSHKKYGEELKVPSFDILIESVEKVHLWYLIEDNNLLYDCLKNGIARWGQMESFVINEGKITGLTPEIIEYLRSKIKILRQFKKLYCLGRSMPIDRNVLEQSGAISERFIEDVSNKLEQLNGNPEKLLQSLKNGEVNKFRTDKIEELKGYLETNNYINEHEILSKEDIMIRINAMISETGIGKTDIERMINNILSY